MELPAQSLSAPSPAADNAFSSRTLAHETKNLTDHRNKLWILASPFLIGDEQVIKRKKKAVKQLKKKKINPESDEELFLLEDCMCLTCRTSMTACIS